MEEISSKLFNSPLEISLRLIYILNASGKSFDLQRLIYYNYLIIHSADVPEAPESMHPALPKRACEMLVNRKIIKKALNLLISKSLIKVQYTKSGIKYKSIPETEFIANHFNSAYSKQLKERSKWLVEKFDSISDTQLAKLMNENIGKWGSEFTLSY